MRVREFFKLSLLVVLAAVLIVGIALAGLLAFIGVTAHKQQTAKFPRRSSRMKPPRENTTSRCSRYWTRISCGRC